MLARQVYFRDIDMFSKSLVPQKRYFQIGGHSVCTKFCRWHNDFKQCSVLNGYGSHILVQIPKGASRSAVRVGHELVNCRIHRIGVEQTEQRTESG